MKASGNKRERGAYFTPTWLAESLAHWAIRAPDDVVVDPSAGGGDLLLAAVERLVRVGGSGDRQIFGVELHKGTARALRAKLAAFVRGILAQLPDASLSLGQERIIVAAA